MCSLPLDRARKCSPPAQADTCSRWHAQVGSRGPTPDPPHSHPVLHSETWQQHPHGDALLDEGNQAAWASPGTGQGWHRTRPPRKASWVRVGRATAPWVGSSRLPGVLWGHSCPAVPEATALPPQVHACRHRATPRGGGPAQASRKLQHALGVSGWSPLLAAVLSPSLIAGLQESAEPAWGFLGHANSGTWLGDRWPSTGRVTGFQWPIKRRHRGRDCGSLT